MYWMKIPCNCDEVMTTMKDDSMLLEDSNGEFSLVLGVEIWLIRDKSSKSHPGKT